MSKYDSCSFWMVSLELDGHNIFHRNHHRPSFHGLIQTARQDASIVKRNLESSIIHGGCNPPFQAGNVFIHGNVKRLFLNCAACSIAMHQQGIGTSCSSEFKVELFLLLAYISMQDRIHSSIAVTPNASQSTEGAHYIFQKLKQPMQFA